MVALLLQLVPVLSMFFLVTTACGSALWVVKLEKQKQIVAEASRSALAGGEDDTDAPQAYTDDPV